MVGEREIYIPGQVFVGEEKARRDAELAEAVSLGQLVSLATKRSYPNPQRWAEHVFAARDARSARDGQR